MCAHKLHEGMSIEHSVPSIIAIVYVCVHCAGARERAFNELSDDDDLKRFIYKRRWCRRQWLAPQIPFAHLKFSTIPTHHVHTLAWTRPIDCAWIKSLKDLIPIMKRLALWWWRRCGLLAPVQIHNISNCIRSLFFMCAFYQGRWAAVVSGGNGGKQAPNGRIHKLIS